MKTGKGNARRAKRLFAAVAAAALLCGGSASAGVVAQCTNDAARLCANVKAKRLYSCLREHLPKLSPGCADAMGQGSGVSGALCLDDAKRLCRSRKMNKATSRCLEGHFDQLSSNCKSYFYSLGWPR